ncbi:hypothetical protein C8J35_103515 [Rhizobium sp. PP-F2F-G38]|nr:hypothetical protein C8J35_103515 [Rhizobium sp. PP-F2F-G38]
MKGALLLLFSILHIVELILLAVFARQYHFVDPTLYETVKDQDGRDALFVASQLGRFDMVSLFLTAAGLFLGGAALTGFWMIRAEATRAAQKEAREIASQTAAVEAALVSRKWIEDEGKALLREYAMVQQGAADPTIGVTAAQASAVIAEATEVTS